jgi:hypothetical protein
MNLQNLPRAFIVAVVLIGGVFSLFLIRKPHSVCDSQLDLFAESQKGRVYSTVVNGSRRPPLLPKLIDNCKTGNSPGACYELFSAMRSVLRDTQNIPSDCTNEVSEHNEIKSVLLQTADLMARIAWGEAPPMGGASRFNWFEASDLALFCSIRDQVTRLYGQEMWESFRLATHKKLPGEPPEIKDGACVNCENRKTAEQVMPSEEIWAKSIFSLRCEQYR